MIVLKSSVHIGGAAPSLYDRPTYIQHTKNSTTGSSITLTKPTTETIINNDLLIIIVMNDNATSTDQWDNSTYKPTGFTFIKEGGTSVTDAHFGIFYRIADGTEGATIAVPAQSSNDYIGFYIHIQGANDTSPIGNMGIPVNTGSSIDYVFLPGIAGNANDLGVTMVAFDGGDGVPFSIAGTYEPWFFTDEEVQGTTSGVSGAFGLAIYESGDALDVQWDADALDGKVGFQLRIVA